MKHYDERKVVRELLNNPGIRIGNREVKISKNAVVGIHAQGKLDYLEHYCRYIIRRNVE